MGERGQWQQLDSSKKNCCQSPVCRQAYWEPEIKLAEHLWCESPLQLFSCCHEQMYVVTSATQDTVGYCNGVECFSADYQHNVRYTQVTQKATYWHCKSCNLKTVELQVPFSLLNI